MRTASLLAIVGLAAMVVASSCAYVPPRFQDYVSATYRQDANWLCRPGSTTPDPCAGFALDSTIVRADGSTVADPHRAVEQPIDCFYVYPTINAGDAEHPNDTAMGADTGAELYVTAAQAARFNSICKLYVPLYRQVTFAGIRGGGDFALAYNDVHEAFKHYMGNFNHGRPIVLIGHSQGAAHLTQLLKDEFDGDAEFRNHLISALLLGGGVQVNPGSDRGGSFQNLPLCHSDRERACVIAFNSFGTDPPPDGTSIFGLAGNGKQAACTNPAALAGGSGVVESYLSDPTKVAGMPAITTPYFEVPGAIRAECRTQGNLTYLGFSSNTQAGDVRNPAAVVTNVPFWGLHLVETNLVQGNLIKIVRAQSAAVGFPLN